MQTVPTTSPVQSQGTPSSALYANKASDQQSQFLQLLVAQLQGQNPLDPKDGSEFVAQLAQFSSLEELVNIRTILESLTVPTTVTTPFQGT